MAKEDTEVLVEATHKNVCKKCVAERGVEAATNIRWSEGFQWIRSTALAENLETGREESSDGKTH